MHLENKIQILSIIIGVLLAFISVYLGYRFSAYQKKKKEKEMYIKSLSIIDANLDWHFNQLKRLDDSLNALELASLNEERLIIDRFPAFFETKILLNSINNLINYKESDDILIRTLIFYVSHVEELNLQLDFKSSIQASESIDDIELKKESIQEYFENLKSNYIQKNIAEIKIAKKRINDENTL